MLLIRFHNIALNDLLLTTNTNIAAVQAVALSSQIEENIGGNFGGA
ncbi:MAG: hypothetical protein FD152_2471 [Xanthobacteraceae bacterium]|nr:MAG: hypothetical protein FD152_2471 [Xanthobacteraceae bacterium]